MCEVGEDCDDDEVCYSNNDHSHPPVSFSCFVVTFVGLTGLTASNGLDNESLPT